MAFWDQEKNKLSGFGITAWDRAVRATVSSMTPAQKAQAIKEAQARSTPPVVPAVTSGSIDPHAVAASVPDDVKKPTPISLPPSTSDKTANLVNVAKQLVQQSRAVTSNVKSTLTSLRGFFGFGAVSVTPTQKVQVTQQAAQQAKQTLAQLKQIKAQLTQHKAVLLNQAAVIAQQKSNVAQGLARKQQQKANLDKTIASIPKTVST